MARTESIDAVEERLRWSAAKISRYELGQGGLKPKDVARLLAYYEVRDSHREQLLALSEDARQRGWWESCSDVLTEGHLVLQFGFVIFTTSAQVRSSYFR